MKKHINLFAVLLVMATGAQALEQPPERKLTPSDELIFAVKGVKNAAALLLGMVNPIFGVIATAYQPDEGNSDLKKISAALDKGADINYQDAWGYTALIYAAYYGYPMIAKHLLDYGADKNIRENKDYNAYEMAQYYFHDYTDLAHKNTNEKMASYYQEKIERYQQTMQVLAD